MSWIIDIVLIGVILIGMLVGYRRGAIRSLLETVGFIAALVGAFWIGGLFATPIFDLFLRDGMYDTVLSVLAKTDGEALMQQAEEIVAALPAFLESVINADELIKQLEASLSSSAEAAAEQILEIFVAPLVTLLIRVILTVVLFVVLRVLIGWVIKVCDLVAKLPVLRQLNELVGMLLGFIKTVIILLAVAALIRSVVPMIEQPKVFTEENINGTVIYQLFHENNIFYDVIETETAVTE